MAIELPAVRILIVDDDRAICDYMQTLLERDGYQVKTLSDPTQVESEIRQGGYHLLILDLMMPRLDGFGFRAAQLRDPQLANIPVILVSALEDDGALARLGPIAEVPKPINVAKLLEQVALFCERVKAPEHERR